MSLEDSTASELLQKRLAAFRLEEMRPRLGSTAQKVERGAGRFAL